MEYIFNYIQDVLKDIVYFKNENQGCYIENNKMFLYNEQIQYQYRDKKWFIVGNDNNIYFCGENACPSVELDIEEKVIINLLYKEPIQNKITKTE